MAGHPGQECVTGIVAEFNPFHNGHAALAAKAGERGSVVAVMSGNCVQRGAFAVTDKRVRAHAALLCGVDLVLELPLPYATAPAQRFAEGAIGILEATGCVDRVLFGSESGDLEQLTALAGALEEPALSHRIRERLAEGVTYARARELALAEALGPEQAKMVSGPNNLLGLEYIRAAGRLGWTPAFETIRRLGAEHDSGERAGRYASASLLRSRPDDEPLWARCAPAAALEVYKEAEGRGLFPFWPERLETAVLARLRLLRAEDFAHLPDLSEGLENRFQGAVRKAATLEELFRELKTKRYTLARLRRLVLAAFLGLTGEDAATPVPYLRVLGFNPRGRKILARIKAEGRLPMSQSLAKLRNLGGATRRFADLEEQATDLYTLGLPAPQSCGYEYAASAVFVDEEGRGKGRGRKDEIARWGNE